MMLRKKGKENNRGHRDSAIRTNIDGAHGNHGAVSLVGDTVNQLGLVGVRQELVAGEDVLQVRGSAMHSRYWARSG